MSKPPPAPRRRGRPPAIAVPAGVRVVKKYGNRRLYDTRESRYVNLDDLLELFAGDGEVRVLDAATGDDLTDRTLRQALLADERSLALVPGDLLRALVRFRRGAQRADFERHLSRALATFAAQHR